MLKVIRTVPDLYFIRGTKDEETLTLKMKIGSNGCVKHCDENKANGDLETWDFAFPYSGRLITMPWGNCRMLSLC